MEILHRFPIIRTQGWEFKTGEQATTLGAADVIDLNQSGSAEVIERSPQELRDNFRDPLSMVRDHISENRAGYKDCGFYEFRYAEPVLATPLEHLEKVAKDAGGLVNEKTILECTSRPAVSIGRVAVLPPKAATPSLTTTHYRCRVTRSLFTMGSTCY